MHKFVLWDPHALLFIEFFVPLFFQLLTLPVTENQILTWLSHEARLEWKGAGLDRQVGRDTDANEIGNANYLSVTPDEQTIYIADSINVNMLELKHN
jgi:hypothetical protein